MEEILMDDLEEARADTGWTITDDRAAEWAIARIKEGRDEINRMECWYQHQLSELKKRVEERESFLLEKLDRYLDTVPTHDTKTMRKYSLPSADLIRKKLVPKFSHDDAELLPFLKEAGKTEFVKVTESVAWADLKKALSGDEYVQTESGAFALKETGEIVPGVTVEDQPEKFDIKLR